MARVMDNQLLIATADFSNGRTTMRCVQQEQILRVLLR